ncbi:MAG: hypothetical protein E6R03_06975 [Hyphomicrobiaceae bacterium]|nr:MAG: hypothetical protein E6R03_06975 [Hyphomicrobiaceae bacterium]
MTSKNPYSFPLPPVSEQLERTARAFWARVKADPDYLITSGELKIISGYEVNDKGEFKRKTGSGGLISPLNLTWPQQQLHRFPKWCRERNLPVSAITLKGRRVGASSYVQARLFSSAIAHSGVKNAVVANLDESAQNLLRMSRTYFSQLTPINRFISTPENSTKRLLFHSDAPGFEVFDSAIVSSTASPEGLERLLGSGTLRIHLSEAAFYSDPEKIELVLAATIMRIPGAEVWKESASNGENNHYGLEFMSAWKKQNDSNFWDDSFHQPSDASTTAIFFSFFADPQNRVKLLPGVHVSDFLDSFDEYEKDLFFNVIIPYYLKQGWTRQMAEDAAVENMGFRRSFLPKHYPGGFVTAQQMTYTDARRFKAEFPASPEEAFEGTGLRTVLPAEVLRWIKDTCREPIFEGFLQEGGAKGFSLTESDGGDVRIFKWPWETSGNLSMSLDPNEGIEGEAGTTSDNLKRDFSYAVVFDDESGEQVAELVSQADDTSVARKVYALLLFMASVKSLEGSSYKVEDRRFPFFTQEQAGPRIVNYVVKERGYPLERVYVDSSMRSTDMRQQRRLGWTSTPASKAEAIKAFKEYMINGFTTRHEDGRAGVKRRIIRSRRLAEQMSWFVVKPSPSGGHSKYQALDKGNWSAQSKDDGVMATVIDCWAQEYRLAQGDPMFNMEAPEVPDDLDALPTGPLSTTEAIALERRMYQKGTLSSLKLDTAYESRQYSQEEIQL